MDTASQEFLGQLVTVIVLSLVTVLVLRRIKMPAVAGYLVAGLAFGPNALGLVSDSESTEAMAEIGILFLLFTTGLKFSIGELFEMRRWVFGAGVIQVAVTILLATAVGPLAGISPRVALLLGCLAAFSSTSVVAKLLEDRGELNAPHGRFSVSLLLLQDLAVVPTILLMPLLAGREGTLTATLWGGVQALATLAGVLIAARFLYPWIMDRVVSTRSRELFTLTSVAAALGAAFLVGETGASLELGAFLAGIVVSETCYGRETLEAVTPLRDVFSSLFFVSIGMLVSPTVWFNEPWPTVGLLVGVVIGKAALVGGLALLFGLTFDAALLAGLGLAQLGEFSFIAARHAVSYGLLDEHWYSAVLSVTVLSMALTPLTMLTMPPLVARFRRRPMAPEEPLEDVGDVAGHVIIVGFGIQGRNVARVLDQIEVPYVVIEMNPLTVREQRALGLRIVFGDAGREHVLRHVGVTRARVLVSTVPDPADSRQIVSEARRLNPDLFIIARTRYLGDVEALTSLGADRVVPEEFETAIEMVGLVMEAYGVPQRAIEREQDFIRRGQYGLLRAASSERGRGPSLRSLLTNADVEEVTLAPDSRAVGNTVRGLELRASTGVTLLGIERAGELLPNPPPDTPLLAGDTLLLFGSGEDLTRAKRLLGHVEPELQRPC